MSNDESKNESSQAHTEDYYEAVASQERTYLDEVEENLPAMLTFDANSAPRAAESLHEQLEQAAEELITGDSDDPPLSEKTITEMLSRPLLDRLP